MNRVPALFRYYGSKDRLASKYPPPLYQRIVEPFAGGASYSRLHYRGDVILVEKDPHITAIWRWLIHRATVAEIMAMPLVGPLESIEDAGEWPCEEALWLAQWSAKPCGRRSVKSCGVTRPGGASFWNAEFRRRLALNFHRVKHWTVIEGDYSEAEGLGPATWFVDPPYCGKAGREYPYSDVDYAKLGRWCRARRGQVIACEMTGADWLPFRRFQRGQGQNNNRYDELIWERITGSAPAPMSPPHMPPPLKGGGIWGGL